MSSELIETSPLSGATLGSYLVPSAAEVARAVERGREASLDFGRRPVRERVQLLGGLRTTMVARLDEIVHRIVLTTGKPDLEALTGDVLTTLDFIAYHEEHAERILASEPRPGHRLSPRSEFRVDYEPLGVIAIISPWNYPLQLTMLPLVTALAAGNAAVIKPSELTPSVGSLIAELCTEAGFPAGLVQVVQGGPEVGEALVSARPDKVFFTGSVATGKKILARAVEHLTPVELELGGKDPMLVFADANFERSVNGAVYGAFVNAGQACVSVERAYVEEPIYEAFVAAASEAAGRLRVGAGRGHDYGPIIRPAQRELVERHIEDALSKGALLTTPRVREGSCMGPVVLRDVSHEMLVMTEETFGPVLPIMPFRTEAQAISLANDSSYGLSASVWTGDRDRASRVVRALVTGNCAVNDVLKNIANPHMPFGGERESGLGRYRGSEGLRAFSRTKSVMINDGKAETEMNWFPYRPSSYEIVKSMIVALYAGGSVLTRGTTIASQWLAAARGLWSKG